MTYQEGRDFGSAASDLSAKDVRSMNARMRGFVNQFAGALRDANRDAAVQVGLGDLYDQAMSEYSAAKSLEEKGKILAKWGRRALIAGATGGAFEAGRRAITGVANDLSEGR
jgi:hypothetical protein